MPDTCPAEPRRPEAGTPLVSIMVPVYNVERYLPQCLDSILAQDYESLDILLVDDGSTDGCGAMCDAYATRDPRVHVLHTTNHGLAAARNTCLAHAQADLLLFVDADDWIEPNTVSTLVSTMLATESDMVCCRYVDEWADDIVHPNVSLEPKTLEGEDIIAELLQNAAIDNVAWGKLCRRNVFSGISYPEGHAFEDIFTTHLVCRRVRKLTCVPDVLFHYRIRSSSISRTWSASNLIDRWLALSSRQADLPDVSVKLQTILLLSRILAAIRVWCWLATFSREERQAAKEEILAMCSFARKSLPVVLRGEFSLMTKAGCIACTVPSPAVWIPLNLLARARRSMLNERRPFE